MEWWLKFIKDYEDADGNKFKAGDIYKIESKETYDSLISLKIGEATEKPDEDSIATKALTKFTENLSELTEKAVTAAVEKIGEGIKDKATTLVKFTDNTNNQKTGGFDDLGHFCFDVQKACAKGRSEISEKLGNYLKSNEEARAKGTPSGLNTRDDVDGGFLVPEQFASEIWDISKQADAILPQTDQRFTSSNNLKINGFEETSRKDGYRDGGVLAYWMAEADQYTPSQTRFQRIGLELHKLGVLTYVTEEEMSDSAMSLGPVLTRKAGNAIRFKVNESFIWGTGVGKPLGVMRSNALVVVPIETNQDQDTILHKNINKMYHRLHPDLRAGASWYVHPNLQEQLEYITFNDDASLNPVPIYMPPGGLTASPYGTLKGRPVIPTEYMKDFGFYGDILFANFSQYASLQKSGGGIKSASSIHVRFLFDEMAFKWMYRIGGQSMWPSTLQDYNGTTERSPFVTLQDRSGESSSSGV